MGQGMHGKRRKKNIRSNFVDRLSSLAIIAVGPLMEEVWEWDPTIIIEIDLCPDILFLKNGSSIGGQLSNPRLLLTKSRVRTAGVKRNQIHSSTLWTLGIPKMCMGALGYNVLILH